MIRRRSKPRRGRLHDAAYMAFIRQQPCIVCYPPWFKIPWPDRQTSHTEAAHVGERGLGQKASDRETLPICGEEHHRLGKQSLHVLGKEFWERHGLDRDALVAKYNAQYEVEREAA